MATSPRKKRCTPQQRQRYVEEFGRSGRSQAEFCRQAKFHPRTFSLWRRRANPAPPAFAEVQVSGPAPVGTGGAAMLHVPGGAKLEIALGDEAAWGGLGLLLKMLQS